MATFRFSAPLAALPGDAAPVRAAASPAGAGARSAARGRETQSHWGRVALQYAPIVAVTVLAKVSVPPLAPLGLGIDVPVILAATLAGLFSGLLRVHTGRLVMYLAMLAWLGCTQLFRDAPFSPTSIVLLATLFLPLTLQLRGHAAPLPSPAAPSPAAASPLAGALRVMSGLALFFAACGVLQFALQIVVGTAAAFPVEHQLPPGWMIGAFNALIPIDYGATTLKSNGVFFLEPSFFSQFIALGLLLELSQRGRLLRVALLVAALAVSYSGTGLIVAAVGLLGLVFVKGRWDLLLFGAVVVLVLVMLGDFLPLDPLLRRATEFQSTRSSGSARFVAWMDMFDRQWWPEPGRVLFGAGAGSFAWHAVVARQPTAEMSFSKMLFEYGVTGALLFFGFLVYAFNTVRAPLALRLGLCTTLLVNGALVAFPVGIAASILLWPAPDARPHPIKHSRRTRP